MAKTIKKGDFIELNYTGTVQGIVFDTTEEKVILAHKLPSKEMGPIKICVGYSGILHGFEEDLLGKEIGKRYSITLPPEKAFGKKDAKLIELVATAKFLKDNLKPYPGLQVNIDGKIATVRRVSAGRTLVDYNHPLSGKEVTYEYVIMREMTDVKDKIAAVVPGKVNFDATTGTLKMGPFPEVMQVEAEKQIKQLIPEVKKIEFSKFEPNKG